MNLVLTFDYELFGDGSGDVFEQMIKPTNQIFKICDDHGIKTTLFFEVIEYIKLKEEWEQGNRMGYQQNPIQAIESQVQQAVLNGHDIQLHIHPQWIDAQYINDRWEVDLDNWRLGDFGLNGNYDIEDVLRDGKSTIESLIRRVKPDYKCIALRAGGYNIMPSGKVFKAMQNLGLKVDSSVYPGGYEDGKLSKYDYRKVSIEKEYWWADATDITIEAENHREVMEVPIFSLNQARLKKLLNIEKIKSLLTKREAAISTVAQENISNKSFAQKIRFLFKKEAFTWDFCMFSKSLHKHYFKHIENSLERDTFVLIGHPKSFKSSRSLISLIKMAHKSKYSYSFKTLKEVYEGYNN